MLYEKRTSSGMDDFMRKIFFITVTLLAIMIIIASLSNCSIFYPQQKISEVSNIHFDDITKISITDVRGKPFVIEDKKNISKFLKFIDEYPIKKLVNPDMRVGYIYMAVFYNQDKEVLRIIFGNPININGDNYTFVKNEISTKSIDDFFKN